MTERTFSSSDNRIAKILNMISKYTEGEFSFRQEASPNGDELDIIIKSLNNLADKRATYLKQRFDDQKRIEKLLDGLLKYTLLDFSEKLEISDREDEIDAIAIGLNSLTEELQAAIELERSRSEALEESNAQIEVIIQNAPNAVIIINEKGDIVRWNKKSEWIFGWKAQEVLHHPMHSFIMPAQYMEAHQNGIERFMRTGEGPVINQTIEITAIRKNKEEFPIELSISAVKSKGEHLFIAFISDISQRKAAEYQLQKTNQHLEDSVKELEAFTYSVSHDLRSPLRAIHGYMNILWNNYSASWDEKAKTMMKSVMANSKKMGQLIDDLLALSRLGRTELQKKQVDMNKVVTTVMNEMNVEGRNPKPEVIIHTLPNAFADANLITQVYTNLISNAIKYSSLKEQPVIEIGAIQEKEKTIYYVKDNGSGFDMQFYNKLFGVFQRLHDASEFEGNGIGLSIVKQIIDKHNGYIWATSEVGKGSTFNFTLK